MKAVYALTPNDTKRLVSIRDRFNEFMAQLDGRPRRRHRRKARAAVAKQAGGKKAPAARQAKPANKRRPGLSDVPDNE